MRKCSYTMRTPVKNLLKLKPFLVGYALFSLMWILMYEVNLSHNDPSHPVFPEHTINYDTILISSLLVIASLSLLLKRVSSYVVAVFLSGLILFDCLFVRFWLLAKWAEVPRFSYLHFSLWYPNLHEGQLLRIILAGVILSCSITSLISLVSDRRISLKDGGRWKRH